MQTETTATDEAAKLLMPPSAKEAQAHFYEEGTFS
jgi:hypothetical protein